MDSKNNSFSYRNTCIYVYNLRFNSVAHRFVEKQSTIGYRRVEETSEEAWDITGPTRTAPRDLRSSLRRISFRLGSAKRETVHSLLSSSLSPTAATRSSAPPGRTSLVRRLSRAGPRRRVVCYRSPATAPSRSETRAGVPLSSQILILGCG